MSTSSADSDSDQEMDIASDEVDEFQEKGQDLIDSIFSRSPLSEILEKIEAGAPVWYQDDEGNSALHAATYTENEELVQKLIEEGAIWNAGWWAFFSFIFRLIDVLLGGNLSLQIFL